MVQELIGISRRHFDVTKKVKFSSVGIGLTVARPAKAKRKICLSFALRIQT